MMFGFAFGTIVLGRMADRTGIASPLMHRRRLPRPRLRPRRAGAESAGFLGRARAVDRRRRRRRLCADDGGHFALVRASGAGSRSSSSPSGNYLAGTIWPLRDELDHADDRLAGNLYRDRRFHRRRPCCRCALLMRRRPSARHVRASRGGDAARPRRRRPVAAACCWPARVAGFSCCTAMSMPQVHIVAYCGDLGYGVARGAEMLSLMLFLGIVSRIGSGFVADAIGGTATLLIGSFMQGDRAAALSLFRRADFAVRRVRHFRPVSGRHRADVRGDLPRIAAAARGGSEDRPRRVARRFSAWRSAAISPA